MAQKWFEKATVQSAFVYGGASIVVAIIGLIGIFIASKDDSKNINSTEEINQIFAIPEPRGIQKNAFGNSAIDLSSIDFKHQSVDEFRFFGGPTCNTTNQRERLYGNIFSASQTVCVYVDIGIAIHETSKDLPIALHKRYFFPDGSVLCDEELKFSIKSGKTRQSFNLGCSGIRGNLDWPHGKYRVEISMNGTLLARGNFNISS